MSVSFFENMQGHLTDRWGEQHLVAFTLKAESNRTRQFLRTGSTRITGVVNAPPWVDDVPASGTLTMDLIRGRRIAYTMDFVDEEDRSFNLSGHKTIKLRSIMDSMTRMPVSLRSNGDEVASGEMNFDLHELMAFSASWRPTSSIRSLDLFETIETEPAAARLSAADREWVAALARAVITASDGEGPVPAADDVTFNGAMAFLERLPTPVTAGFMAAAAALDVAVRLRTGASLVALPEDKAREVIAQLASPSDKHSLHRIVHMLAMSIKATHFSRSDYLSALGVPTFEHVVREPEPDWMSQVTPAEALDTETTIHAEVVVIGTGAGGGAIAAALAEQGVAVAVVEAGRFVQRSEFSGDPLARMRQFYRDAGFTFSIGTPPIFIPTGSMVGGTTAINSGTCFRTPDAVLEQWRRDHGLSELTSEHMAPYLDAVVEELQVGPGTKQALGKIADVVATGADAMGLEHGPLPRNAPGCDGQGMCPFGCPTDARRSSNVSWIPRALQAGAELFTGLPVTRLLRRGRRVVAIEARGSDRHGAPKTLRIHADAVVMATGTLTTPLLLADNGFNLPWMGRNLSVHPAFGAYVMCDEDLAPWNAIPQGYGVQNIGENIKFEGFWMPPQVSAMLLPAVGEELTEWMGNAHRVGQYGFMVRDENTGRVRRGPGGKPIIQYSLSKRSLSNLRLGTARLVELLLRGGGDKVMIGLGRHHIIRTVHEAQALEHANLKAMDYSLLGAHPLGTCRMGTDASNGVVDQDHRVFGTDNLYVVDGSTVPTSLGVNPQITIMAMALRAGARLAAAID